MRNIFPVFGSKESEILHVKHSAIEQNLMLIDHSVIELNLHLLQVTTR